MQAGTVNSTFGDILINRNFIGYYDYGTTYVFINHPCMTVDCRNTNDPGKWLHDPVVENEVNTTLNDNPEFIQK